MMHLRMLSCNDKLRSVEIFPKTGGIGPVILLPEKSIDNIRNGGLSNRRGSFPDKELLLRNRDSSLDNFPSFNGTPPHNLLSLKLISRKFLIFAMLEGMVPEIKLSRKSTLSKWLNLSMEGGKDPRILEDIISNAVTRLL